MVSCSKPCPAGFLKSHSLSCTPGSVSDHTQHDFLVLFMSNEDFPCSHLWILTSPHEPLGGATSSSQPIADHDEISASSSLPQPEQTQPPQPLHP